MKKIWQKYNKNILIGLIAVLVVGVLLAYGYLRERAQVIDYTYYEMLLENNFVQRAVVGADYATLYTNDNIYKIAKDAVDIKVLAKSVPLEITNQDQTLEYAVDLVLLVVLLLFLVALLRNVKKSNEVQPNKAQENAAQKQQQTRQSVASTLGVEDFGNRIYPMVSNVTFNDVAGINEVKEELEEIIDFLKHPKKYKQFGVQLPRGVLLIGPPGVGKTLIAKAVAGEAGVPFFYHSGSAFVQIYVGMGAKRVRELFTRAKAMAPSIIFIDEIDAVGKARGGYRNDEREATLNQLLTEMDGFEDSSGVIVIGATNKIEMLDEALLRSGRFDRRVFVGFPTFEERKAILHVYLHNKPYKVDVDELAKMTVGFSGAAIASLVNEAAICALKRGAKNIELQDFISVKDKVLLGKRKKLSYSEEEKKILATYQAAKAIAAYWFDVEFDRVSLIGDGLKEIDKEIISKSELVSKVKVYLAGAAAMEVIYNENYSNNQEDLMKAKMIANEMVERYGMGGKLMGDAMDAVHILQEAHDEMKKFINGMDRVLHSVEAVLLERETISKEELRVQLSEVL